MDEKQIEAIVERKLAERRVQPAKKMVPIWPGGPLAEVQTTPSGLSGPVPRETDPAVLAIGAEIQKDVAVHRTNNWGPPPGTTTSLETPLADRPSGHPRTVAELRDMERIDAAFPLHQG